MTTSAASPAGCPIPSTPPRDPQGIKARAHRVRSLAQLEARMLLRRRGTMVGAALVPLLLVAVLLVNQPGSGAQWAARAGQFTVIALLITVYMPTATTLVARRETQVFKRMRTSEISALGLLSAIVAPLALVGVLQAAVVAGAVLLLGGPAPQEPALLVAGAASTLVQAVALGAAVASITRASEQVQFSSTPVLIAAAVASQLITTGTPEDVRLGALAIPMAAGSSLMVRAWGGPAAAPSTTLGHPSTLVEIALLLVWTVVAVLLAHRFWRWEPRR